MWLNIDLTKNLFQSILYKKTLPQFLFEVLLLLMNFTVIIIILFFKN